MKYFENEIFMNILIKVKVDESLVDVFLDENRSTLISITAKGSHRHLENESQVFRISRKMNLRMDWVN